MKLRSTLALAAGILALAPLAARAELVLPRISPKGIVTQTLGTTELTVTYSRPGVKGRTIWGELVPYDAKWRTGANEATTLSTTDPVTIGGKEIPAGTYSLFTVPAKSGEWTVTLNSGKDGVNPHDPAKDVHTFTVRTRPADHQEWMAFTFENLTPTSADLVLRWEKLALAIPVAVDVNGKVLTHARAEVAAAKADDWRTPYRAADWAFTSGVELAEAAKWLDQSIRIQPGYSNLSLKARWLMKDGKKSEAVATARKAVAAGKASKETVDTAATEKLIAEWTGKAEAKASN